MLSVAAFSPDAAISVLDVGGGYGMVTEEVLRAFPHARVTLQDYSQPMLDEARQRLAQHAVRSAACSAISAIRHGSAKSGNPFGPDALFLDYDLFDRFGGIAVHTRLLQEAGFARVDCVWQQSPLAIVAASSGAAS